MTSSSSTQVSVPVGKSSPTENHAHPPPSKPDTTTNKRERNLLGLFLKPLLIFLGLISLSLKRLKFHSGLTFLALLGVILAVGLVTSASFFAQAVDQVILTQVLSEYSRIAKRPPFAARVYTFSSREVPLSLERSEALGQNVAETLTAEVGLPLKNLGLQIDSGVLSLEPRSIAEQSAALKAPGKVHLVYITDVENHIAILEGQTLAEGSSSENLEVWMHKAFADKTGAQVGDIFEINVSQTDLTIPIEVMGIWQNDAIEDAFWFVDPDQTLTDSLLVRRNDYASHVEPRLAVKVRAATWNVILDEASVNPTLAREYLEGFGRGETVITKYLPDVQLTAPSFSLEKFVQRQSTLTILLLGFNIPAFGFLLYFLVLTSAVIAYWQQREVAVLVSRGMSPLSILNFTFVEELIIILIGLPLGLGFGVLLAQLMGDTDGFLSFSSRPALPISYLGINLPLLFVTLSIVLLARLLPTLHSARQTVIDQEREHNRPARGPLWYRYYLDLLLIIPTWYAYGQLSQRGTLALLARDRPEDIYQDPLLVIVPALFILTIALLAMRLFPLLMRLLDMVAGLTPWLAPHLALRQLGRQHHNYINPLLLVIVCLALGVYTLSLAASLDQWLIDRTYYQVGTDVAFTPFIDTQAMSNTVGAAWIPSPQTFETLPGVEKVARVGDYTARIKVANHNNPLEGRFLAVDRIDFAGVSWFRDDFASESLGGLMNRLAAFPDGVLVSEQFLRQNTLSVGDQIQVDVVTDIGATVKSQFTIVGSYRYFPTVYDHEVVLVGNLEYLFSFFGLPMPHRIWVRTHLAGDSSTVLDAVPDTGVDAIEEGDTPALIRDALAEMERVGVFGTLSISFLAAAAMAILGLLTYSYASLHERLFTFAVLRAMGVKQIQVVGQVFIEYMLLTAYGTVAGVLIGIVATNLFVPLFRVTGDISTALPPLLPIVAQEQIIPLAALFAGTMILMELIVILIAMQRHLFRALRMGHLG